MNFSENEIKALLDATKDLDTNQVESDQEQDESKNSDPEFSILCWNHEPIRNLDLKSAGWKRPKHSAPVMRSEGTRWVVMQTGEILTKEQVQKHGIEVGPSISMRMIRTQSIVLSCPKGKRDFVLYILKLRNTRGGLVVDLKTALDRWIAYAHPDMHSTDRSRKRRQLETFLYDRGILANNQTFTKELQFIAHSTKSDYLGESSRIVNALPIKGKPVYDIRQDDTALRCGL